MSNETIKQTLDNHGVPYQVLSGHIFADSMDTRIPVFGVVVDVTNWASSQLLAWLGY